MMLQSGATAREGSPALAMPMRGMAGRPAQAFAPPAFPGPARYRGSTSMSFVCQVLTTVNVSTFKSFTGNRANKQPRLDIGEHD